jgi:hypothetical protein
LLLVAPLERRLLWLLLLLMLLRRRLLWLMMLSFLLLLSLPLLQFLLFAQLRFHGRRSSLVRRPTAAQLGHIALGCRHIGQIERSGGGGEGHALQFRHGGLGGVGPQLWCALRQLQLELTDTVADGNHSRARLKHDRKRSNGRKWQK